MSPLIDCGSRLHREDFSRFIAEAEREGWLGGVEGLRVSLAGAEDKLARVGARTARPVADLPIPTVRRSP